MIEISGSLLLLWDLVHESLRTRLIVSGSLQAFFKISLLELFRTLALNRRRFMIQSRLYSSVKKLDQHISLAGRSIHPDLNVVKERRGGSMVPGSPHLALCPLC